MGVRAKISVAVLVMLVVAQTAVSLLMPTGDRLTITSDIIQGFLLLVATAVYLPNFSRSRSPGFHVRLFWGLMTAGMLLWLLYQGMWNYFEVVLRVDVPNPFLGDIVLFMHLVPMIGALAVLPHLREDERDQRIRMLDFALLLTWWIFIYVYAVIPWQTVQVDEPTYSANFNFAYLTEKLVLLLALAILAYCSSGGWRQIYGQLLGASALYASSSYVANWAISRKLYYSGSIYDVPLTLSMAWMAAAPLLAAKVDLSESRPAQPLLGVWITRTSMLALFSLTWTAIDPAMDSSLPLRVRQFRVTVSLLTMVVMGIAVFLRQRLLRDELSHFLDKSRRSVDDLRALQEQLIQSEKLASMGQLVGGAAHEINNPLTAMLGYSDLLSTSSLPREEKVYAGRIGEEVRRTTALVASLLTFARQAPARLSPVDLNSVLQTAGRLLEPRVEAVGRPLRIELSPTLPLALADSNQILHVCTHLGGQICGRLDVQKDSGLFIRTHSKSDVVMVDFLTQTAGTPAVEQVLFSMQLSADGPNKPSTLSLSACCRIAEEHGGRILQGATPDGPAFRLELQGTTSRAAFTLNRAAAQGIS